MREASGQAEQHRSRLAPGRSDPCGGEPVPISPGSGSSQMNGSLLPKTREAEALFERSHRHLLDTGDSMDVKNVFKAQEGACCPRGVWEQGGEPVDWNSTASAAAGAAGERCAGQARSHPTEGGTCQTDSHCLSREGSGSGQCLADVQVCKETGLVRPLTVSALLSEQADAALVNHRDLVKDDAGSSAPVLESHTEQIPSARGAFDDDDDDDDLEYFECSDVLTAHENEIWNQKLEFLLDSDDEDDLKLSKDCDGCAYFLGETPCRLQVSDNTTPMDITIGFCGHHSKFEGVNVRRDPSVYSQSALQAEMTLTRGHHREKSASVKDKEKCPVPVASAAIGSDHPGAGADSHGSGRSDAGSSAGKSKNKDDTGAQADSSAGGIGSPQTGQAAERMTESSTDEDPRGEGSLLPEEPGGDLPEEDARHAVCTLRESLTRNLLKLFNPKELCRYVSTIGQSFQLAAELRESSASSQEGAVSTQIPEETASSQMQAGSCHTEEADKDCHWERTWGLSEQDQMPDKKVSSRNQGANLNICIQIGERRRTEPETGKESDSVASKSAGALPPASDTLAAEKTGQAQTCSQPLAPWHKGESCLQQVTCEQGINAGSTDGSSRSEASPFPSWDWDSACEQRACSCAALPPAGLPEDPGEGEHRYSLDSHDSNGTDALCSLSCDESPSEANPEAVLESGEPGGQGAADISAVHDQLWKILNEDDSDYQITYENQGITSLEIRPIGVKATELSFVQEPSSGHPLPANLAEEQAPVTQPATGPRPGKEDCSVSSTLLQTDEVCNSASTGNICLAPAVGTDGMCLDSSTENKMETPSICVSANGAVLDTGESLEQEPNPMLTGSGESIQVPVDGEGKPAMNNSSQTHDGASPGGLQGAHTVNLACDTEAPSYLPAVSPGTTGQFLLTEHSMSLTAESVSGAECQFRGCHPARTGLPCLPEEKDMFPADNTSQLACEEHSSVSTTQNSCEEHLPEKGNHSALSAQTATSSDSCHLSQNDDWQELQVPPGEQKHSYGMQVPDLIEAPEMLPQNTEQLAEVAKQEAAPPPTSGHPCLRGFSVEAPSCEPCKPGEQSKVCMGGEERAAPSCDSGVSHSSESQATASPPNSSEQDVLSVGSTFMSEEELNPDSSNPPTSASGSGTPVSVLLPSKAQRKHHRVANEGCRDYSHQLGIQQVNAQETLCTPVSQAEAGGCAGTGSQAEAESTQTAGRAEGHLGVLETSCRALQEQLHGVLELNKQEPLFCESKQEVQRTVECSPDKAETKVPLHALVSSKAQGLFRNTNTKQPSPDLMSASKQVENLVKSSEDDKDEELMTPETVVSGLVNLPSADAVNSRLFQEQAPCKRTPPFSLVLNTHEPFPVSVEGLQNQEGSKSCQTSPTAAEPEPTPCKQGPAKSGHFAAGAKTKLPPATLSKKPRLEEGGKGSSCVKKPVKSEAGTIQKEDRKEQRKLLLKKDGKAPKLLKKIQAELFPDRSGNIKLCCQFGDIHGDSTITWTKDSKLLAQLQRSAQDDSPVSLAIAKASSKDQGMYYCCLSNTYGQVTAEFNLTAEGVEEIEFMQLMFREDFIRDSYFGGNLHGIIATEELHFGEGMHRKAFRSKVMQGLVPVFSPGHPCVLKVHSAITYGTKSKDDLVQKNYKLALQECYVQNTAREYAKIYAAEAEPLEGFGEAPEIIPIFLVHRPANNIPYATVEEELVGEFVKYSMRDGKEVNFLRRDSEAGQKCCTFQHWVYEKTNGSLLVTDLQGVGMKLTDVGIATLAKGYKGFKGNCSISFIEQFRALHQCNKYCEMLGLKALPTAHQKQRKVTAMKSKTLPNSSTAKKTVPKKAREPRDFISSEH
ncbi:alpha-protein kinase 2 isoform X2 [Melanerpes formicivorus]|uniref:alpha-protein kinase 2 isoform X2 n=1 Tax=Melanerpes formicivorus TaxID=211600 RepID=UPI003590091C